MFRGINLVVLDAKGRIKLPVRHRELLPATRHGEHKVRSQGARDRRALTGEAGNASRRQVIVGDAGMNPIRDECASDAGRSRPNNSRVMRTNFGGMTAEIFREHSDSLAGKESQLVLTIDTESPCLLLYPIHEWESIEEKLQALPSFNPAVRRIQRLLVGHATDLYLDKHDRILLPALLRNYAHLEKKIMVVGQGRKIELWGASEWDNYRTQWISETVKPGDIPDELQTLAL